MPVTEEAGSTARTLIQSLASTPVILALVAFNVFYIAAQSYELIKARENMADVQKTWERMVEKAMEFCPQSKAKPQSYVRLPLPPIEVKEHN
jgi:hypothetical protein